MAQIHKRFTDDQVKDLIERYLLKKIERKYIQEILNIGKARFFELLQQYRADPDKFSIQYVRKIKTRSIDPQIEKNIIKELKIDKKAIQNKDIPLKYYNYSYIQDRLQTKYKQKVSLPTIIDRAKKNDFYIPKKRKKKVPIKNLNETKAANYRNKFLGFVFQSFYLLPELNCLQNVCLPAFIKAH